MKNFLNLLDDIALGILSVIVLAGILYALGHLISWLVGVVSN